ncbi:hypothetical protein CAAN1_16S00122 [[Candida] anglica]|uniref:Uncharacterized protein n=1 Tax=[Candida] anglica TaxID=148631 RepID=A0ABP0EET9_9ASCO
MYSITAYHQQNSPRTPVLIIVPVVIAPAGADYLCNEPDTSTSQAQMCRLKYSKVTGQQRTAGDPRLTNCSRITCNPYPVTPASTNLPVVTPHSVRITF